MPETDQLSERKAAFEARTEQYSRLGYDRFAAADFVAAAAGRLTGPALDIGTGRGITALALVRQGLDVVTVDTDADEQILASLLAAEKGLKDRIRFLQGDAADLPYPEEHFGCAAMMDVLHHLKDPTPVLEETARVLRPSGIFILAEFTSEGFELVSRVHQGEGRDHPVSGVTLKSAEALLSGSVFEIAGRRSGHKHDVIVFRKKAGVWP